MDAATPQYPSSLRTTVLFLAAFSATAGCGSDSTLDPMDTPEVSVSITPDSLTLVVGETGPLTATVVGSTAGVTFTSSSTSVATVDGAGLVTAIGAGVTTITAAVSGSSAQATAQVRVTEAEFSIAIVSITQDGQPIDPDDVSGIIDVALDYDVPAGFEGWIDLLLDDLVVASVELPLTTGSALDVAVSGPSLVPGQTVVEANTARVSEDPETGDVEPFLPNRVYRFSVGFRFGGDAGHEWPEQVQLNNRPGFLLSYQSEREAEVDGTVWRAGQVNVEGRRVSYGLSPEDYFPGPVTGRLTFGDDPTPHEFQGELTDAQRLQISLLQNFFPGTPYEGRVTIDRSFTLDPQDGSPEEIFVVNDETIYPTFPGADIHWDDVAPSSPIDFSSGVAGEHWVNDSWTSGRIAVRTGIRFDETVVDGGSGSPECQLFGALPGEDGTPFDPTDWDETVQPRVGLTYVCHDATLTEQRFPMRDPDGEIQLVGIDRTNAELELIFDPLKYTAFSTVNPPLLIGANLTDPAPLGGSSDPAGVVLSVTRLVEDEEGPLLRECLVGELQEDGTCKRVEHAAQTFDLPLVEVIPPLAVGDGVYFVFLQGYDGAGNLSDVSGVLFANDHTPATLGEVTGIGDTWDAGESYSVSFSAADNLSIKRAGLRLRYGDDLTLGYGPFRDRSDLFSLQGEDRATSVDLDITVGFQYSVQNTTSPADPVPGPDIRVASDLAYRLEDHAPENAVTGDLPDPQFQGTSFDFTDAGILWHGIDALSPFVCSEPFPDACVQSPTEQVITFESRTAGADTDPFFSQSLVIPFVKFPRSPGTGPARVVAEEDVWLSAEEFLTDVTVTSETSGSHTVHTYEITLDATLMPFGDYEITILGFDDAGHALMSPSESFSVRTF